MFNVHVNRSPIAGVIRDVRYQRGQYLNAMNKVSAEQNEQNIVTVEGDGQTVVFKQIAGLLARRIVFYPKVGDRLERGQRVGLIKFGSRVDVLLDASARMNVKIGDRVKGGASVLAYLQPQGALDGRRQCSCHREGALMDQTSSSRPRGRHSKGMYILPSLFTTANMAMGYYAILAGHARHRDRVLAPRQRGQSHRVCGAVRRARRAHRAHDRYQQRFRQGIGFSGRRDHLRRGSSDAGVELGI